MKWLIGKIGLIVLMSFSCTSNQTEKVPENIINESSVSREIPQKFKNFFKVPHQNKFSFEFEDIEKLNLIRVDSLQFLELFENTDLVKYNNGDTYEHYFYSYQESTTNYQPVTILVNRDYRYDIYYLVFTFDGILKSKLLLAGKGGDGPFSSYEYGKFINDTTYLKTRVSLEFNEGDENPEKDSITTEYIFDKNGKLIIY